MTYYTHRYSDVNNLENYEVIANYDNGTAAVTDQSNEVGWINQGNIPKKISGNRFIIVKDNIVSLDPNMETVLMTENETAITVAVQALLDSRAQQRGYDDIFTLISYHNSLNPIFQTEGQAGLTWRDAVWTKCLEIKNDVIAGNRSMPTVSELIAELPEIVWP
jgi:hypothetical protein